MCVNQHLKSLHMKNVDECWRSLANNSLLTSQLWAQLCDTSFVLHVTAQVTPSQETAFVYLGNYYFRFKQYFSSFTPVPLMSKAKHFCASDQIWP